MDTYSPSGGITKKKRRFDHSAPVDFALRLVREKPLGTLGAVITLILLFVGVFAGSIAPYGMNETKIEDQLQPPSSEHWLGTDNIGRDIFSRVIYGARVSVIVGLAGPSIATIISLIIGMVTGYVGGKVDLIVQRFVDTVMSLPALVLIMVIIAIVKPGIVQVIFVLGIRWGITGSRVIRGAVMGLKQDVYVEAAKSIGCTTRRIFFRHLLPNIMAPTIILFTTRVPGIIMSEASLSFLGFGIPPPTPTWGGMLSGSGRIFMLEAPWMAFWPGLALALVVYAINMFGDAVRDLLDPRLRGGVGRYGVRKLVK